MYDLYELIWNRFVACQMSAAVFEQITVDVRGGEYLFRATDSIPQFRGFLQVYDDLVDEAERPESDEDPVSKLPSNVAAGEDAQVRDVQPNQHFTKPPARFTESTLVKELESLGIGRPSTYALIVDTIQARKYVDQQERRLYPTELGKAVNKILVQNFPKLFNVDVHRADGGGTRHDRLGKADVSPGDGGFLPSVHHAISRGWTRRARRSRSRCRKRRTRSASCAASR